MITLRKKRCKNTYSFHLGHSPGCRRRVRSTPRGTCRRLCPCCTRPYSSMEKSHELCRLPWARQTRRDPKTVQIIKDAFFWFHFSKSGSYKLISTLTTGQARSSHVRPAKPSKQSQTLPVLFEQTPWPLQTSTPSNRHDVTGASMKPQSPKCPALPLPSLESVRYLILPAVMVWKH